MSWGSLFCPREKGEEESVLPSSETAILLTSVCLYTLSGNEMRRRAVFHSKRVVHRMMFLLLTFLFLFLSLPFFSFLLPFSFLSLLFPSIFSASFSQVQIHTHNHPPHPRFKRGQEGKEIHFKKNLTQRNEEEKEEEKEEDGWMMEQRGKKKEKGKKRIAHF